jgi:Mg2+/Co2+ transporter CorB
VSELPIPLMAGLLFGLILLSACFSGSETALMAINRYRLRHRARQGHRPARMTLRLLDRPDRLIGLILLGNNFVNILASMLATLIALEIWGQTALGFTAIALTIVILIFAEVAPKTFAATRPEALAYPAAFVYTPLLKVLYPLVWLINLLANGVLRMLRLRTRTGAGDALSSEELRTAVNEAGSLIPEPHQEMLVNILDLEKVSVDDIMIPRSEIQGIDIEEPWEDVVVQLREASNSRLAVYRENIDDVVGFVFLRDLIGRDLRELGHRGLLGLTREPYFVPEGTSLTRQMLNFQRHRRRIGLVVDEYGDILGLVTLEDILEEIVGEFTTDRLPSSRDIHPQSDGTWIVAGSTNVRDLTRHFGWRLDTGGPKTLNGLILEYMEMIPEPGTTFLIADHPVEILQTRENAVRSVRIHPRVSARRQRGRGVAEIAVARAPAAETRK